MTPNPKDYYKSWYQNNKEEHLKYLAEKITCDICNCEITRGRKNGHNKSQKHLNNLKIKELETKMDRKEELLLNIKESLYELQNLK